MTLLLHTPIPDVPRLQRRGAERKAALRLVQAHYGPGASVGHAPSGAPQVMMPCGGHAPGYVSLSHTGGLCVLAVDDCPVGVDAERLSERIERVAPRVLTGEESGRSPYGLLQLAMLWTAKEAVYKCADTSSLLLTDIDVTLYGAPLCGHAVANGPGGGRAFDIRYYWHLAGYVIAVAHESIYMNQVSDVQHVSVEIGCENDQKQFANTENTCGE